MSTETPSVSNVFLNLFIPRGTNTSFRWDIVWITLAFSVVVQAFKMVYYANIHPLRAVPGPWISSATSVWIRWQRWNGKLSFEADKLMTEYGPIVRISPNLVILNDSEAVERIFMRKDLDTSPKSIRALRVGGHDWTVTYPQHPVARLRRHPVMIATTTKNLKLRHEIFVTNTEAMVRDLAKSEGARSEDIVIMGGSAVDLDHREFPRVVGEYNFLVVWRLCLPEWLFGWLQYGPFPHSRFRVQSSDKLFELGEEMCRQAAAGQEAVFEEDPSVYKLFTDHDAKYPTQSWTGPELGAEMAGQVLAATETTSSALAFIYYELARNQRLQQEVYEEAYAHEGYEDLDSLKLLDACIKEGLRFRPPVALTGSRMVPEGGMYVLDYFLPAGTVITTQSLSMSRQRPDLFPDFDSYNPRRWLDNENHAEKRRLLVPFGIGARRCPGGNMATYQMRLILAATFRAFKITLAPETTPEAMAPFEANGYRSRHDRCDLIFTPRAA
ncbi:cytochrome P450 monooxygenase-like protein [Dothidotthia symphoricarpi CBS 119687]|uniref:Cytochrome P450 monooxygenase-like protein n=1 Tax=Dothidotthia symphoricarpi CBS 119687 TaxID=1392245 RepID=A0A6A5ZY21_9PLEO|nr:cytochrome P450 monooxygenase-like protein [Dothidotthia symphoricarpi CBS 119687]KAF2124672.1 cytochrome P450 monooxygenase-like protein [Dothidotthia symphoricarpi CBS 119687]